MAASDRPQSENEPPNWVSQLHEFVLFGEPDLDTRTQTRAQWNAHFAQLHAESGSVTSFCFSVLRSAFGHLVWRVSAGPATLLMPAALSIFVALASPVLWLTGASSFAISAMGSLLAILMWLVFGYEAQAGNIRHPFARFGWGIAAVVCLGTAATFLSAVAIPADAIAGAGFFCGAAGAGLLARSRKIRTSDWKAWATLSIGLWIVAISNLAAFVELDSDAATTTSLVLFAVEAVTATALGRWALARRSTPPHGGVK